MSSFHFGCDGSLHCSLYCPHTAHLHDVHVMSKQSTKCGSRDFDIIFFNVRGSDTTLKRVCTLGIRTLDSMRRCTRNVVLATSLKTFTTLFFQKCFLFAKRFTKTLVLTFEANATQVGVSGTFASHFFQRLHLQSNFVW